MGHGLARRTAAGSCLAAWGLGRRTGEGREGSFLRRIFISFATAAAAAETEAGSNATASKSDNDEWLALTDSLNGNISVLSFLLELQMSGFRPSFYMSTTGDKKHNADTLTLFSIVQNCLVHIPSG